MSKFKNKKTIFLAIGILVVGIVISFGIVFRLTAQTPNIFGGFVTMTSECGCSGGFLLTISPPVGGQFVYQMGTPQFPFGSLPRAGVWALGIYSPGGVCMVFTGKGCGPSPLGIPIGTITPIVGTSL